MAGTAERAMEKKLLNNDCGLATYQDVNFDYSNQGKFATA